MIRNFGVLAITAACVIASNARLAYGAEDFSSVYGKANKAVVLIESQDGLRDGSGVVVGITKGGSVLIATAHHVVSGYDTVLISFAGIIEQFDGEAHERFFDDTQDLAIVVVYNPPPGLGVISFRKSAAKKGENIGTIGHPLGEPFTWSEGSITNIHGSYITHDAALERGSSGGPLLDGCGRMLGMNVELREPPEEAAELEEDTLEGSSVALCGSSIVSAMEGWFSDTRFKEKWQVRKYCSFWERLVKDPVFLTVEAAIAGGILWTVTRDGDGEDKIFGEPPSPPDGR